MGRPGISRASRRTVLQALAGGGIAGVAGAAGWVALGNEMPTFDPGGSTTDGVVTEAARLVPRSPATDERFGAAAAVADGTALVGAPRAAEPNGRSGGAVTTFERSFTGWRRQSVLAPTDGDEYDRFGGAIVMDGGTALIGARGADDPHGENGGAVYAFEKGGTGWTQAAKLTPTDGSSGDTFGTSIGIANGTALVGAATDETPNGVYSGSAYVFERSNGTWSQQTKLAATDGDEEDAFGAAVAVTDDTAVVSAPGEEDPHGKRAGAAYVFVKGNDGWFQRAKLVAPDGDSGDDFGRSVGLTGDTAFVGAPLDEDPHGRKAGAVYVFERSNDGWAHQTKLTLPGGNPDDWFGRSMAVPDGRLLVSAKGDDDPNGKASGAVYLFERSGERWARTRTFAAANGMPGDRLGWAVSLGRDRALATAVNDDTKEAKDSGAAYVFSL